MLQDLLDLTNTTEFKETGYIIVERAKRSHLRLGNGFLEIELNVYDPKKSTMEQWEMVCQPVLDDHLVLGRSQRIEVIRDHILLWPYITPNQILWFSGSSRDPHSIIGQLWDAHDRLVGDYFSFSRFINPNRRSKAGFLDLIAGGHGQLAQGPEPLIVAYQKVMNENGFKTSITVQPRYSWERRADKLVALIIGQLYAVTTSVKATLIATKEVEEEVDQD